MANKKSGGLINRLIMGKEKSEGYARASLPSNRWELFWDVFKGRFWKLVLLNLLTLLFFIPLIAIYFFNSMAEASYGILIPYSQAFGVGYQAFPALAGIAESMNFSTTIYTYFFLPIGFIFVALGLSGSAYVMRNLVWTEGVFVANDFWKGVKQNAKQLILFYVLCSIIFYFSFVSQAMCQSLIVNGQGKRWLLTIAQISIILVEVILFFVMMHGTSLCVTYDLKLKNLIKNSFLFTIALVPQNIFFTVCGMAFMLFVLIGGALMPIGVMLFIFIGLSWFMLIWTDYCQWLYDKFINDKVEGAKKNRGIYEKIKNSDSKALQQYKEQLAMVGRSTLSDRPIKPITDDEIKIEELPTSFNRADIEKLNKSKQALYDDNARYIEEHKDDPEFLPTEEDLEKQKILEEREKRIEKAKRELMKRNKNK